MATLEEQIRAANWGGEWDAGGTDRVAELAGLLRSQGITNLGALSWTDEIGRAFDGSDPNQLIKGQDGQWYRNTASFDSGGVDAAPTVGQQIYDERSRVANPALERRLRIGDQIIGFLGNANNDGSYTSANQYTQIGDRVGWSARGDGNVSYNVVQGPNGLEIRPTWGSSSDADKIRSAAMLVGGIVGGGMALDTAMYGSVGGGMAASGGAAGTAGAAGATAGSGTAGGTAGAGGSAAGAAADPIASYLTTGAVEGSTIGGAAAGGGGAGAVGAGSAAAGGSGGMLSSVGGDATRGALYSNSGYGTGMTGTQTSVFDGVLSATGNTSWAATASDWAGAFDWLSGWGDYIQAGSDLFSNPLVNTLIGAGVQQYNLERAAREQREWQEQQDANRRGRQAPVGMLKANLTVNKGRTNGNG